MKWILALCLLASSAQAAKKPTSGPSADEILRRVDEMRTPGGDFSFTVQVEDIEDNAKVRDTEYRVFTKGDHLARVETTAPERLKGRKLLMRDNDLWLYLPSIKRPTRVSFQQRLTGEVSNGDIARVRFHVDYKASKKGTATVDGKPYLKLNLAARRPDVTYRRIELLVDPQTYRPFRAGFYAVSGKLLKTGEYSHPIKALDREILSHVVIKDAVQTSRGSNLRYGNYQREKLDDSFFNKESLP
jgi:outer membrane lipoprotein-sorting protein